MPADVGDLRSGAVLGDRYRLEEPLGRGSTAHVWRARDLELGRVVALKLLGDGVDAELRARFGREGTILGRLSHPNLVAVHGTGSDGDRPFLIMDLVDGVPLDEMLRRGPLPWQDAACTVAAVAAGLGEAHRHGVLHRDVKPANVLCGHDGRPRLVDFGIARAPDVTTMTGAGQVLGTAFYLAPEQAQAAGLTPAADVYALGCVLFEAVAGRPPFEGDNPLKVAVKHVNEEPPSLATVAEVDIPAELDAVVARCLAKPPGDRYPTASELEADLRRVVAGEQPLLGGDVDATGDPAATTSLHVATPTDAASGTMVLPAVTLAGQGEVVDRSPLVASDVGPAPLWARVAIAAAVLLVFVLLASAALAGGSGADDAPAEPVADVDEPPSTVAEPPPAEPAPPVEPAPAGDDDGGGGKAKGKGKKGDD